MSKKKKELKKKQTNKLWRKGKGKRKKIQIGSITPHERQQEREALKTGASREIVTSCYATVRH